MIRHGLVLCIRPYVRPMAGNLPYGASREDVLERFHKAGVCTTV